MFQYAADDIIERLHLINKNFRNILDLGCRFGHLTKLLACQYEHAKIIATDISEKNLQSLAHNYKFQLDDEKVGTFSTFKRENDIQGNIPPYFDLITFSLGLHWINDVPSFLKHIGSLLEAEGIFIGNFIGGNSLKNLRAKFIEVEEKTGRPHFSHISPFIHFDHITPLLQQAGFKTIIVDYENIGLEYNSPLDLMKVIRNIGESAALLQTSNYAISKKMLELLGDNSVPFVDQVNLISLIASKDKNVLRLKKGELDQ